MVIVHPTAGVTQSLSQAFARYLWERDFAVLTYDDRGTVHSRNHAANVQASP